MISKKLKSLHRKFLSVNLMTDVFKIITKHRQKIVAKYRQISLFMAYCETKLKTEKLTISTAVQPTMATSNA